MSVSRGNRPPQAPASPPPAPPPPPPDDERGGNEESDSFSSLSLKQKRSEQVRKKKLVILEVETMSQAMIVNRVLLLFIMWLWLALLFTVLVFLGIVLVASRHVQKRNVLLLHPWGLLLLYIDVFVWLFLTIIIQVETDNWPEARPAFVDRMEYPFVFFLFIYLEVIGFALLYYFYATFFISAELTVIEKFFP